MKRVSAELETGGGGGPEEEELIVQGVRYAFRVHQVKIHLQVFFNLLTTIYTWLQCANAPIIFCQFAGGFDVETMRAFQELREKARSCHVQCQNQQQQKLVCRSTPC